MKRKKKLGIDPFPPQVPGAPVVQIIDKKKRIKVTEDEIKNLAMLKVLVDRLIYEKGMNLQRYQQVEKIVNKKIDGKAIQINTLLQTYKTKYKIVGEPIDWDPETNELILK